MKNIYIAVVAGKRLPWPLNVGELATVLAVFIALLIGSGYAGAAIASAVAPAAEEATVGGVVIALLICSVACGLAARFIPAPSDTAERWEAVRRQLEEDARS